MQRSEVTPGLVLSTSVVPSRASIQVGSWCRISRSEAAKVSMLSWLGGLLAGVWITRWENPRVSARSAGSSSAALRSLRRLMYYLAARTIKYYSRPHLLPGSTRLLPVTARASLHTRVLRTTLSAVSKA